MARCLMVVISDWERGRSVTFRGPLYNPFKMVLVLVVVVVVVGPSSCCGCNDSRFSDADDDDDDGGTAPSMS